MARFELLTIEYQDYDTDLIGISKDARIDEANPTFNFGGRIDSLIERDGAGDFENTVIEITMPDENDIQGFDELVSAKLILNLEAVPIAAMIIGAIEINDEWDEDVSTGAAVAAGCDWEHAQPSVPWSAGNGAVASREGAIADGENVAKSVVQPASSTPITFDFTNFLKMGETKTFVLFLLDDLGTAGALGIEITTREGSAAIRPILEITYKDYPPEGFDGDNDLIISPNPDNPEQPILTWGATKSKDFKQYRIYKSTNPITSDGMNDRRELIDEIYGDDDKFYVSGDLTASFPVGSRFTVIDNVLYNGIYTVKSITYNAPNTEIETDEDLPTDFAIASVSDVGAGIIAIWVPGHTYVNGDDITLSGTTTYDGTYSIFGVGAGFFEIFATWGATSTGYTNKVAITRLYYSEAVLLDSSLKNWIDTGTLTDSIQYYYRLVAEDLYNVRGEALLSANVSFTKPDVTSATMTRTDAGAWNLGVHDVGTSITMTVVSPQKIKKMYIDWKDGVTSWYEFETVALSQTAVHIFVQDSGGAVTPDIRIQDELGFWSGLTAGSNTVDINDTTPTAKLIVSAKEAIVGDDITLNATFSQPAGSNITITKYEFKRDAAEAYINNGTDPIFTFDSGVYPNSVGTKTASVQITTDSGVIGSNTDADTATYDLVTGTPTDITPGAIDGLSNYTSIHDLQHIFSQNKDVGVPIGASKTAKEFLVSTPPQKFTIHASTEWPMMEDDLNIIRSAWENNTYLRLEIESECETKTIQYDFMLEGDVSVGHQFHNKLDWSFPVRVINRTEVAKAKIIGDITAYADPGGGKVNVTSVGHGLVTGMVVLIRGTINYNGTYEITKLTDDVFKIVHSFDGNDAMGTWAKVGES